MTYSRKNEVSYETLVEMGLPRLPEGYFYKFSIGQTGETRGHLYCRVYSLLWGFIPCRESSWHKWHEHLPDPSQGLYDVDDFVDIGKSAYSSVKFPPPKTVLPSQGAMKRFLNRRLP